MAERSILEGLNLIDVEAIDLMRFTSQKDGTRPVSDRMQRRVLKMFATWVNDAVLLPLEELAQRWDMDESTLRRAVKVLVRDNRLRERKRLNGRLVRGVNWQRVYDEVKELATSRDRTGQLPASHSERTGQLTISCPESTGQLIVSCPDEAGTTARTYKNNLDNRTTPTTEPLSGEWLKLKDELFQEWKIDHATRAVKAARDEGWTLEAIRELRSMAPNVEPVQWYQCLTGNPNRLYTPDEALTHYRKREAYEREERARNARTFQIDSIRYDIREQARRNGWSPKLREAKHCEALKAAGLDEAIDARMQNCFDQWQRERTLQSGRDAEPVEALIERGDTLEREPQPKLEPLPESAHLKRSKLARQLMQP